METSEEQKDFDLAEVSAVKLDLSDTDFDIDETGTSHELVSEDEMTILRRAKKSIQIQFNDFRAEAKQEKKLLNTTISRLEQSISLKTEENQDLNQILQSRTESFEKTKKSLHELQECIVSDSLNKVSDISTSVHSVKEELSSIQMKINIEKEKVLDYIHQKEDRVDQLMEMLENTLNEVDVVKEKNKDLEQELERKKENEQDLISKLAERENQLKKYKKHLTVLQFQQQQEKGKEELQRRVNELSQKLEEMKSGNKENISRINQSSTMEKEEDKMMKSFSNQMSNLEKENSKLRLERENALSKISQFEREKRMREMNEEEASRKTRALMLKLEKLEKKNKNLEEESIRMEKETRLEDSNLKDSVQRKLLPLKQDNDRCKIN